MVFTWRKLLRGRYSWYSYLSEVLIWTAVYGQMKTASPLNHPGNRRGFSGLRDFNNNVWLFGGSFNNSQLNDLWLMRSGTFQWTWIAGRFVLFAHLLFQAH